MIKRQEEITIINKKEVSVFPRPTNERGRFPISINGLNTTAYVEAITDARDINEQDSRRILVESFINEYSKYLQPSDIDKSLTSWRGLNHSVQQFYQDYFEQEYKKFSEGHIDFWVCAYVGSRLVGWATFEREKNNSVYMDLLIVDPNYQHKGIGQQLVLSLKNLELMLNLSAVHLLLREKNKGGREFYKKMGFFDDANYQREDNYVDRSLLTTLTYHVPPEKSLSLNGK